ncbi:hypothetical protein MRX96_036855 [Rhipicephalus microplus]
MGPKAEGGCGAVLAAEFRGAAAVADDAPVLSFERESGGECCCCGEEVGGLLDARRGRLARPAGKGRKWLPAAQSERALAWGGAANDACCVARWRPGPSAQIPVLKRARPFGEGDRDGEEDGGVLCSQEEDDVGEEESVLACSSLSAGVDATDSW